MPVLTLNLRGSTAADIMTSQKRHGLEKPDFGQIDKPGDLRSYHRGRQPPHFETVDL